MEAPKNIKKEVIIMSAFVNFTNHPSKNWCEKQMSAALQYGSVIDLPFPSISPKMSDDELLNLAKSCVSSILALSPACVLCQGETVFTCLVANMLMSYGVCTVSAVSRRNVYEQIMPDGNTFKKSVFEFECFRKFIFISQCKLLTK